MLQKISFHYPKGVFTSSQLQDSFKKLKPYLIRLREVKTLGLFNQPESFVNLPFSQENYELAWERIKNPNLKYFILIGVGGSSFGTSAIYHILKADQTRLEKPKIIFGEAPHAQFFDEIEKIINTKIQNLDEIAINLVSKSGLTIESLISFEIVSQILKKKFSNFKSALIITTTKKSSLWQWAQKENIKTLPIPEVIPGRFSIFSNVGMFPLYISGFKIKELLGGARQITNDCLKEDFENNPALSLAIITYLKLNQGGKFINNFFGNPELKPLGRWLNQLLAESLGKHSKNLQNKNEFYFMPVTSVAPEDLHARLQLYLSWPEKNITQFVFAKPIKTNWQTPNKTMIPTLPPALKNKNIEEITKIIYQAIKETYQKNNLFFTEVILPKIDEGSIGQYLQFKMIETIFLAKLLEINAFNQPRVEDYKALLRNFPNFKNF